MPFVELGRDPLGDMDHGAATRCRRRSPLSRSALASPGAASSELTRNFRFTSHGIEDRRDEPFVERAQAVDEVAELRLRGDDLDRRVVRVQRTADAGERAAGPHPGDEVRDVGEVGDDLARGPFLDGLAGSRGSRTGTA